MWMLHIGRARHPGPGPHDFPPGQLSVEFINVGGWLTSGDLALDSCAQFLAVAEHRLIPSRARSVCHQLRRAGHHSVWAPACQDKIVGGHAGVGVVSLGGAPLSLPSFVTPQFQEFFSLGRVLRTTLPTSQGGVVHLFIVYGYQGVEEDAEKLRLTDRLLQAVLAEAQVVCLGQPLLIAGDLNADPAVIPCLAKGISVGRYVDLALAHSLGAGVAPDVTCRFNQGEGTGTRRDFFVGCPGALAASQACFVTDRWFTPHFSVIARFRIGAWMADVACPIACQPIWPACWLDIHDWSSSSSSRLVQDVWDVYRNVLGVVPNDVVLALRDAVSRSAVDDFWSIWSRNAEAGLFRAYALAGGPTDAGSSAFLGRGLLRIRSRRLGGRAVGGTNSSRLYRACQSDEVDRHCAQFFINSSLSLVLLFRRRLKSVADVLKRYQESRHTKIRDQNPSLGYICPGEPHERSPNAPKFEDRSLEETEWQEQGAREAAWKLAKSVLKLKEHQRATFFSPSENRCLPASTLKPEEREFVVDSRASMHMISKEDLSNAEMDTLTKSSSPTIVITANGEVQTHEEAIVYVKELEKFLTMKVLDNTPAVLSLGKLCDENGYSYEWINGQKPHLIKDGIRIICNTENFVPIVVPGLSSSPSASSSTLRTSMKQESHSSSSSSSSSSSPSSPAVGEISVREREDAPNKDISPVPVSELVDDRSGKPEEIQANKTPKTNKKETTMERGNPCDSEIPHWLQEFRENLVDDEIPLQESSHDSSSHEVSSEPTAKRREDLGKHNVHTHFPKDRNCEIYKRTKITRAPCRRRNGEAVPRAANFGDLITADHKVLSDNCESRNNHRYAVVVQDLATQWIQAYPCKNKTSQETQRSLQKFLEPELEA